MAQGKLKIQYSKMVNEENKEFVITVRKKIPIIFSPNSKGYCKIDIMTCPKIYLVETGLSQFDEKKDNI